MGGCNKGGDFLPSEKLELLVVLIGGFETYADESVETDWKRSQ
jgi:hypothetical protein